MSRPNYRNRPECCEQCGETPPAAADGRSQLEAHHDDYSKPKEVRWLCVPCHKKWHIGGKPKNRPEPTPSMASVELRAYRDRKDVSQEAFAERIGCTRNYVSMLESGAALPGRKLAVRIQEETGIEVPLWDQVVPERESVPA